MNIFCEIESMKMFLKTRKFQLSIKDIIVSPYDTLFTKKLLMDSLKMIIYPEAECVICAETFTKTYEKQGNHMCEHMQDICFDCWERIITHGNESCPVCRYNFRDNFEKMYEFYAIRIQTFIRNKIILPEDTQESLTEFSEKNCYRCATLIVNPDVLIADGSKIRTISSSYLEPNTTHSYNECKCNSCNICFGGKFNPIDGHGHCTAMCKFNNKNLRHLVPEAFQHQFDEF